jgi:hypothetical protein
MPVGIIKYDLDDPHERDAFNMANTATDAYLVIWDMQQELRRLLKYEPINADGSPQYDADTLEYIREFLSNTIENHGVNMENLK